MIAGLARDKQEGQTYGDQVFRKSNQGVCDVKPRDQSLSDFVSAERPNHRPDRAQQRADT